MGKAEDVMGLLKSLKEAHPEIKACMVAKKGLEGLILFPETFKNEASQVWEPLSKNVDDMLSIVDKYSYLGQKRLYSELLGFGAFFLPFPMTDTALIVFVKCADPLAAVSTCLEDMEKTHKRITEL